MNKYSDGVCVKGVSQILVIFMLYINFVENYTPDRLLALEFVYIFLISLHLHVFIHKSEIKLKHNTLYFKIISAIGNNSSPQLLKYYNYKKLCIVCTN